MEIISPDDLEADVPYEGAFLTQVVAGERMSVQHFRAEPGLRSPVHSHEHEEVGYLAEGSLTIGVDGEEQTAETGDVYRIPGGVSHYTWNGRDAPAIGIMIFSPPRPYHWSEIEE